MIFILIVLCWLSRVDEEPNTHDSAAASQVQAEKKTKGALPETPPKCGSCTYIVAPDKGRFDGKLMGVKPGDVLCLSAHEEYKRDITFWDIVGEPGKPVIITNCGGTVSIEAPDGKPFVIRFNNSKFIRFTGGNVDKTYGIKLQNSKSNGLIMGRFTTNFEVDHIEISNVGFAGIMAKTDPDCDDETIRGNFTMRDVSFHHNYVHDTGGEGFYIGHTAYGGKEKPCGIRMPHLIENVKIYNNIVRNSGWDGIQLASAPTGAAVYNNIVENYSTAQRRNQSGGICISGGTGGVCYGNLIKGGFGPGIAVFGQADNTIYNNIIINPSGIGIFCDERLDVGAGYRIINNTFINVKKAALLTYAEKVPINVFVNNIVVGPMPFDSLGNKVFVSTLNDSVKVELANNYFSNDINELKFVNPDKDDFRLTRKSPAVDKGQDITRFSISKDFYNATRLKGSAFDIGASEY